MARDLRRFARQTQARLILGGLLILFLVGGGLIWFFYGRQPALMGLACLVLGLSPLLLIWIALTFIGWLAKRLDQ
jgi:hypothetical protein